MKIGIEIHQRLDSHKLFCDCPSTLNEGEPDMKLLRRLHPVYSELGEVDLASRREFERGRTYEYYAYKNCNCLVETDEEPPHKLNEHALGIALEISLQLNCKPVDEIHVMRKTIIDGSNTSGFQRTSVIAMNGLLETKNGTVRIPQISIEEESSGIVGTENGKSTFRLDRLGIPLIEITTDPDIKDPEHLVEVAEKIGMIMRATGKVARGLGTIRQDLNVSIEGGARVEIKGAQDLKMLRQWADEEAKRQRELVAICNDLEKRLGGKKLSLDREFTDVTKIFSNTESKLVKSGLSAGAVVLGLRLPYHAGLVGKEIQTGRRYGTELSDYAKTAGVKGIIHSDEDMRKYSISEKEVADIRKTLKIADGDAYVLVVASKDMAKKALDNVCWRAEMGRVPNETRRANPDGSTSYMRPLPGKARLYPETDIPPISVTKNLVEDVKKASGESLDEKKDKLAKLLNKEMADRMLKSRNLPLFERLTSILPDLDAMLIANTLENTLVSLRREGAEIAPNILEQKLTEVFEALGTKLFVKAAIPEVLKRVAGGASVQAAISEGKLQRITGKELEKIAKENGHDIAKIMQKYRLNIEPADLAKIKR